MSDKPYKRQAFRFVSPKQQFLVLLPVLAMLFFGAVVSFSFLSQLRDGAVTIMKDNGVPDAGVQDYLAAVRALLGIFWGSTVFLCAVGFYWGWLVSHRIFGPFRRLEQDLELIRQGTKDPSSLYVREKDYVADLIKSIRDTLVAMKKGR